MKLLRFFRSLSAHLLALTLTVAATAATTFPTADTTAVTKAAATGALIAGFNTAQSHTFLTGASVTFAAGSTLTLNGALAGTPTGGTLNLSALTLTLPATVSGGASSFQPLDSDLTAIAALTTTANGRSLLAASALTATGLGLANGANLDLWGAKTLPAGAVVGTTDTQTLTNKAISGATNTLTAIPNSALGNSSLTLGSTSVALGSTTTTLAGLTLTTPTIDSITASGNTSLTLTGGSTGASLVLGATTSGTGLFTAGSAATAYADKIFRVRNGASTALLSMTGDGRTYFGADNGDDAVLVLNNPTGFGSRTLLNFRNFGALGAKIGSNSTVFQTYIMGSTGKFTWGNDGVQTNYMELDTAQGTVKLAGTTPSTSTTTGALIVAGGVGVAGNIYAGGTISTSAGSTTPLDIRGTNANAFILLNADQAFYLSSSLDPATSGVTKKNSVTQYFRGSYWNGSSSVTQDAYIGHTIDSTAPATHLSFNVAATEWMKLSSTGVLTLTGPTGGLGYGTGAGGTVTQATSRTTGVTLSKVSGAITLVSAAGATSWQTFTVTNTTVAATDTVIINQKSGTDLYEIHITAVGTGSFNVSFKTTGGTTTEQPVFNFAVIKAVSS